MVAALVTRAAGGAAHLRRLVFAHLPRRGEHRPGAHAAARDDRRHPGGRSALYVLINIALAAGAAAVRCSPLRTCRRRTRRGSCCPGAGAQLVTVISLLTVLSLINAVLLMTPRILLAIGRDGFFTQKAAAVSAGGTPRLALGVSSAAAIGMILSGTFEQIVALATVLFLLDYIVRLLGAVRACGAASPICRGPIARSGFHITTGIVLAGRCSYWLPRCVEDPRSGWRRRCCCSPARPSMPGSAASAGSATRRSWPSRRSSRAEVAQSKSVGRSGRCACSNMRSICAAVARPVDSGGSASRAKNAASLVSMLVRALPPVISQMKNIL